MARKTEIATAADIAFDTRHDGAPSLIYVQDGSTRVLNLNGNCGPYRFNVDSYLDAAHCGETVVTFYTAGRRLREGDKALSRRAVVEAFGAVLIGEYRAAIAKLEELRPDHARLAWHKRNVQEHADALEERVAYDIDATVSALIGIRKAVKLAENIAKLEANEAAAKPGELIEYASEPPADIEAQRETGALPDDVYQDGADFYHEERGHLWSAPYKVADHDIAAAERARVDFLAQYKPPADGDASPLARLISFAEGFEDDESQEGLAATLEAARDIVSGMPYRVRLWWNGTQVLEAQATRVTAYDIARGHFADQFTGRKAGDYVAVHFATGARVLERLEALAPGAAGLVWSYDDGTGRASAVIERVR